MKRHFLILSFVAVFLAGGVVGGAVMFHFSSRMMPLPPDPSMIAEHMLQRLKTELDLTPQQEPEVKKVLDEVAREMSATHERVFGQVSQLVEKADERIASLLTAEQQVKFAKFNEERRSKMRPH